jgi:hypothetical protein
MATIAGLLLIAPILTGLVGVAVSTAKVVLRRRSEKRS